MGTNRWSSFTVKNSVKYSVSFALTKNSLIGLVRSVETAANSNERNSVYRIAKEFVDGRTSFVGSVGNVNGMTLIYGADQLKKCREHCTMILNLITSSKVPPCGLNGKLQ